MKYKNKVKLLMAAVFLSTATTSVHALVIPKGSQHDARVQTVTYSPYNVTKITAQVGKTVLVQLEKDEFLAEDDPAATVAMGDALGWNLSVHGNNIVFKPAVEKSDTNMVIVTNKRTYVFQLEVNNDALNPTYVLRFDYPDTAKQKRDEYKEKQDQAFDILTGKNMRLNVNIQNQEYWGFGDAGIAPTAMYDDGLFTYFEFNNGKHFPTIYKKMPDGTEALVNKHVQGNTVIVHELNKDFVLRLGQSVLGIENRGFNERGRFNNLGTNEKNAVRIIKNKGTKK